MLAAQITSHAGPEGVVVADIAEPEPGSGQVLIDVHAAGVSFPDVLVTKGEYQVLPQLPFTLGSDVAGTVLTAPVHSSLVPGDRVMAVGRGGLGERAIAAQPMVARLPATMSYVEGAAFPLNYLTAQFTLMKRAGLTTGETLLVNGAAGGLGTAMLQLGKALGATTIGVVSSATRAEVARAAGADHAVLADGFREAVAEITGRRGVNVLVDIVGGDAFTDALRSLAPFGRVLVVGFASGQGIPTVKVNRLLMNNVDVRGAGWGDYVAQHPEFVAEQWQALAPHLEAGRLRPYVGMTYPLSAVATALADIAERRAFGKLVVTMPGKEDVRPGA